MIAQPTNYCGCKRSGAHRFYVIELIVSYRNNVVATRLVSQRSAVTGL